MNRPAQFDNNLATGADEAVQSLDQQAFQALLFNSFLNQQGHARGTLSPGSRLQGILEILRELGRISDQRVALNFVTARALKITGATGAAIAVARDGEMVCEATSGATAPDLGVSFSLESGLSGECVRTAGTLLCDDTENDRRVNRQGARSLSVRSIMLAPIKQMGAVVGVLEVFAARAQTFGPDDLTTLEILAEIVSAYLTYAREREARRALEAGDSGMLQIVQQLTAALQEDFGDDSVNLTELAPETGDSALRLARGVELLGSSPAVPPTEQQ